jgi:predicted nucleic acid-binding protein
VKVVLDTNILVSGLITPDSPPHRLEEAWESAHRDRAAILGCYNSAATLTPAIALA